MTRRAIRFLVTLALAILVAPLAAEARPAGRQPRIGFLSPLPSHTLGVSRNLEAFRQGLHALGYTEGQHLILEYREAPPDRLAERAAELVRLPVDVLVTWTTPAIRAAKQATPTIPIVMAASGDPIRTGFVASLARPGGNITGLTIQSALWRSPAPEATRGEWFAGSGETASLGRARRGGLRGNGYLYDAAPYVTKRPEGGSSNALRIRAPSSSVIVRSGATSGTPARGRLAVRCTRDSNAIESATLLMWTRNRSMFVHGVSPPSSYGG